MSIKTQKVLMFIPVVNIITIFSWLGLCARESIEPLDYLKELLKTFLYIIAITAMRMVFMLVFDNEINNFLLSSTK